MALFIIIIIVVILSLKVPSDNSDDPIDRAVDKWDSHPEDLDMEDMFWLDEVWGDDD